LHIRLASKKLNFAALSFVLMRIATIIRAVNILL